MVGKYPHANDRSPSDSPTHNLEPPIYPMWSKAEHPEETHTQTHHREDRCRIITTVLAAHIVSCSAWRFERTGISVWLWAAEPLQQACSPPTRWFVSLVAQLWRKWTDCLWLCCLPSDRLVWDSLGQMPCFAFCRDNILVLDVFFEALNYETIEQKKAYEVAGLLGRFYSVLILFSKLLFSFSHSHATLILCWFMGNAPPLTHGSRIG